MSNTPSSTPTHAGKWFEIPAPDLEHSQTFYQTVLQRSLRREVMGPNTIAVFPYAEGGSSGCLHSGATMLPPGQTGTLVYLDCNPSLDAALERVLGAGGRIADPKRALPPGMGFIAHIIDVAGNRVGLYALA
jgi:predicted enzyme related to lactoylglutathione lyase